MKQGAKWALRVALAWAMMPGKGVDAQHPDEMAVATFNIRYDNPGDPVSWDKRREKVISSVGYMDIIGFQEALAHQVADLAAGLAGHDHYGLGRDDGASAGEHCPLFWRRDRFDLLHSETRWLSATPDVPGSIGWDAELPRIATLVLLHDRKTGKVIRVVNTHFSHIGEEARALSARMLSMQFTASSADVDLLLGDLNAEPGSRALEILLGAGLADAHDAADKRCRRDIGTYTGFQTNGLRGAPRIDHILLRGASVPWYCTDEQIVDGFYISDHLPVYIALIP